MSASTGAKKASLPLDREPPLAFAFALLSTILGIGTMRILGTPMLDMGAYQIGIGVACGTGFGTGLAVRALRRTSLRRIAWLLVPLAGAIVGMGVQWLLLARAPETRTYILATGLTTSDPISWVVAGAPLGALPALIVVAVVVFAFRVVSANAAQDSRERVMLPFAGACALLGAAALGATDLGELPILGGVILLAVLAMTEILVRDRARRRWLRGVFSGEDTSHEIVPIERFPGGVDAPLVVGAVMPEAVIVRVDEERGYRGAALRAIATTALVEPAAIGPLRTRQAILISIYVGTAAITALALAVR